MAPGAEENEDGKHLWIGPAGKLMREMAKTARINIDECWLSNIEKVMPPNNELKRLKELGRKPFQDLPILKNELESVGVNCVLGLGEHALKGLTGKRGIKKWRGSILESNLVSGLKVVCTYHTSALLRSETSETKAFSYSARAYMQNDFNRAAQQSKFREIRRPERTLQYARSYDEAEAFFDLYRDFDLASVDIETTKGTCIPTCIGVAFNRHHGMSFPLLNVGDGHFTPVSELIKIIKLIQRRLLGNPLMRLIMQNGKFDLRKLIKPFAFRILAKLYHDTGMCNHILYPEFPKSMQFLTSTWTEEPYYKDELAEYDPEKQNFTDILLYNAKDVCVPYEIYEKQVEELEERGLTEFFYRDIMPLSDFYQTVEDRGIDYRPEVRADIVARYSAMREELTNSIDMALGYHLEIKSPKKVAKALFEDLGLPKRKNTKEDTLVQLLATHCQDDVRKYTVVSDMLDLRKINRNLDGPLSSPPDYDGKMRTLFNINAATNGRTGNNLLKPPERPTKLGQQFQNQSKYGEIGPEARRQYVPGKGKIFVQVDMSQAEARVVAALARDTWRLECFRLKKDLHSIVASWYFDKENPESDMDPIGVDPVGERFIGKTTGHAISYFCMAPKLMLTINKLARKFAIPGINVSIADCKKYRAIFLKKSPKIPEVFWKETLLEINKKKRTLVAASGRSRTFFGLWDPNLYYSYIPSASVTDHNKFAAVRIAKRLPTLEILKEDHDSITFQCEEKYLPEIAPLVREEYERPLDLSRCSLPRNNIIIPVDFEVGYNLKDMKKWRPNG